MLDNIGYGTIMKKIDSLTSLRFFAALCVALGHTKGGFAATAWMPWFPYGYGVICFFVLSGFILSYVYPDFRAMHDVKAFYVARIARIWPLHLVTFAIFLLLTPSAQWFITQATDHRLRVTIANLFLVQAWIPKYGYMLSFNPVSYTLSMELFFYIMFPFLFYKWRSTWHWKTLLVLIFSASILTIATARGVPNYTYDHSMTVSAFGLGAASPFVGIVNFMLGMLGASIFKWLNSKKLPDGIVLWTIIEVAALYSLFVLHRFGDFPSRAVGHVLTGSPWLYFSDSAISAPSFMVIIIVIGLNRGAISKMLTTKPLILLGETSFALYLIHLLFFMWLTANRASLTEIPDWVQCFSYWTACFASAFALWALVEKPCRIKLKEWILTPKRKRDTSFSAIKTVA